ncbi:MAG: hypothetical protein LBI30_01860 [Holosporales bacterium]|jgi:hypothetical protein|nr:hypothetical protein [Holosporales bacterium]
MKNIKKMNVALLAGIISGSSASATLTDPLTSSSAADQSVTVRQVSRSEESSSPVISATKASFPFSSCENVHIIAPRIKAADAYASFIHNDNIFNFGMPVMLLTSDLAVKKLNDCMDFVECLLELSFTSKEKDLLINTTKKFWSSGYDKIAIDPETGICPLEFFSRCFRLADETAPNGFSFLAGALIDAADPRSGGLCLQGYIVRLMCAFNNFVYEQALANLNFGMEE